jgi:hypothetical protein
MCGKPATWPSELLVPFQYALQGWLAATDQYRACSTPYSGEKRNIVSIMDRPHAHKDSIILARMLYAHKMFVVVELAILRIFLRGNCAYTFEGVVVAVN